MERGNTYQTPVTGDANDEEARREDAYASEHPDTVRDGDVLFDEREPEVDSDGNPVLDDDGNPVYKEREQERDEDGNPVFDADGNAVHKGQVTEERDGVFDQERDPLLDPDGDSAESDQTRRVDDSELVAADLADNDAPTRDFTEESVTQAVPEQRSDEDAGPVAAPVSEDLDFDRRWHDIKAGFVDDPRHSVEEADALIDEALSVFTAKRQELASRWQGADNDDTEQLRLALREYRGLFDQLKG